MCDTNISALYKQDKGALKWVTETVYMPMLINKKKKKYRTPRVFSYTIYYVFPGYHKLLNYTLYIFILVFFGPAFIRKVYYFLIFYPSVCKRDAV